MSDYVASTGSAAVDMGSIADSTEDVASGLDKTNDNAKKLQKTLSVLSFDELNQLNDAKVSNSSGSSGSGGGASAHLPELDAALDKALSEYQAAWDKAFEEMNNKANDTADQIVAVFKKIRKAAKPTTASIKKLYDEGLSKLGNFSITALKDLWNNYLKPIGLWMLSDNSGLPRFFNITNDLLNKINWGKLNSSLSSFFTMLQKPTKFVWTGLMDFYEKFLVPVGTWTMNSAIPELVDALTNFGNNIHWDELNSALKNFWDALAPFAQNVGQGIVDFFKDLLDVGENFINTTLPGGLNSIADAIKNISPETAQAIGKGLGQISIAILGFKGLTFIGGIIGKDSPLGKGLALLAKHPYAAMALGISGIVLALDNFGVIDVDWEWIWSSIDRVKTSIQNFIDKVDWNAVGTALGNLWSAFQPFAEGFADALITGLEGIINIGADLINGIANAINWLAEKLSGVDPEFIKQVGAAFGTLFAIKIAKDIATKIFSFASGIGSLASKLLNFPLDTASSLPTIIGDIGGAAETAATGGLSSFSSTLGTIFGTSGIVFVATALSVKLARGIASITEAAQGGNGILSQTGGYLHDYTGEMESAHKITQDQAEELWKLIEADESAGKSNSEMYDSFIQKLGEFGVSTEDAKKILEKYGAQAGVSTGFLEDMTNKVVALGDGMSETDGKIDTSKIKISDLKDVLYQLSLKSDDFGESYKTVWWQLDESKGTLSDSKDAFDLIYNSLKDMGVPLDEFDEMLKTDFPDAVVTMETNAKNSFSGMATSAKTSMGTVTTAVSNASSSVNRNTKTGFGLANTAVSTAMAGMKKSTESTMPSIWSKIKNTNDDVETNSKTNWGNSASAVSTALGTMDTDTKDVMGKVMTTIQSYWSSVLINTNQIWEKASGKVDTETGKMLTYAENNMSSVARVFSSIRKTINGNFSGLYSVGLNAMNDFKRGIESVDIKTPHLQMNYTNWQEGNTHKWRWNSNVEWYAKGGLFNGAQVIGIGEAGSEAVLPLENPRTMKKIADSIVSSSDGSMGLTKEEMTKAVAQGVAMAMSMNGGNKNPQYIMNSIILDGSEIAKAVTKAQNDTDSRFNPSPAY